MPIKAFKVTDENNGTESLILFEVSEHPMEQDTIPRRAARPDIEKIATNLKDALTPITAMAELLLASLKAASPGKITLEFGVELGGKAGIPLVTQGEAKANIKVSLEWERDE